jgi:NAD(P)-dependent dehydrogenase (short-subunit alcohol dehydrogenase family)
LVIIGLAVKATCVGHSEPRSSRWVLVTGAASGIGEACTLHLTVRGFRVLSGVRKRSDGEALRKKAAGPIVPVLLDVTSADSIAAAAARIGRAVGEAGLSGLVNNAGIAVANPLEFLPLEEMRRQLEVNVLGHLAVTQALLPLLRKGRGRIVNMSSIAGRVAWPFLGPYTASKFALEGLSDCLRMELRPFGVRVSLVEPGSIATPIWKKSRAHAETLLSDLPPGAQKLYGKSFVAGREAVSRVAGIGAPVTAVARAVTHALSARSPRIRYLVGWDARLMVALRRWLPSGILDRLLVGAFMLQGRRSRPRDYRKARVPKHHKAPSPSESADSPDS